MASSLAKPARPEWMDRDRVDAAKRRLPSSAGKSPVVTCRTLRGERVFTVDSLKDLVQAREYAKAVDATIGGKGYKSGEMRHARR